MLAAAMLPATAGYCVWLNTSHSTLKSPRPSAPPLLGLIPKPRKAGYQVAGQHSACFAGRYRRDKRMF